MAAHIALDGCALERDVDDAGVVSVAEDAGAGVLQITATYLVRLQATHSPGGRIVCTWSAAQPCWCYDRTLRTSTLACYQRLLNPLDPGSIASQPKLNVLS
jgi:hypothetical protein